ncbi:MAG TPA: DUF6659 family protein [Nitrosopumilaceae archaeon]|nr:DUF6659 family protein [Nitrosopumilaceae archaeon]
MLMLLTPQQHLALNTLCDSILCCNKKICFTAVISEKGRVLESKDRHGVIGCLPTERKEAFYMEYALRQRMRNEFNDDFGLVRYTCAEREKEILFSFPLYDFIVLVACGTRVKHVSISRTIIPIIDECKAKMNSKTSIEKGIETQEAILA